MRVLLQATIDSALTPLFRSHPFVIILFVFAFSNK